MTMMNSKKLVFLPIQLLVQNTELPIISWHVSKQALVLLNFLKEQGVKYVSVIGNRAETNNATAKQITTVTRAMVDIADAMVNNDKSMMVFLYGVATSTDTTDENVLPSCGLLDSSLTAISKSFKERFANNDMLIIGHDGTDKFETTAKNFGIDYIVADELIPEITGGTQPIDSKK